MVNFYAKAIRDRARHLQFVCRILFQNKKLMDFLVIDDDKTFRDATCFLIEEAGHYAEGVESGRLGLDWLKEDKWDAVLLDVNLGKENGLDVLVEIQKRFPQVPV